MDRTASRRRRLSLAGAACLAVAACAQSPLGRQQILFYPEDQVDQMGSQAFAELKREKPLARDPRGSAYAECIVERLAEAADGRDAPRSWEVVLFRDPAANAFALPGGKIGVNTGMLEVARTPDMLAGVLGHEMAHVIAHHTNERLSTTSLAQTGLGALQALGGGDSAARQQLFGLLGVGTQIGVLLPFSRTQESEADRLGLEFMARAGFDPRQMVDLWQAMERQSRGEPPEFLSTHPSEGNRIARIRAALPLVQPLYERAAATRGRPDCRP